MRLPIVAGQFYPESKSELISAIKQSFEHKLGKQMFPEKVSSSDLKAIISPHAGFVFSGPCASHAFYEVGINKTPETYIMLGLSHQGNNTCLSDEDFETPLGIVKNNVGLTRLLSKQCNIEINNKNHHFERSLEVLLPFLQFVKQNEKEENVKIVPLMVGRESLETIKRLAIGIKTALKDKDVIFLVSSDFTHYGPNYGYMPDGNVKEMDMKAIGLIKKRDALGLFNYHEETAITICGIYPIILLLELVDFNKADLLSYYHSTDIMAIDRSNSVSYASISFR